MSVHWDPHAKLCHTVLHVVSILDADLQEVGSMRLAAGNGADAEVRKLLPEAVLQLADRHGNSVATADIAIAARLAWPARSSQRRSQVLPPGAELPVLHGCSLPDATVRIHLEAPLKICCAGSVSQCGGDSDATCAGVVSDCSLLCGAFTAWVAARLSRA